MRIVCPSCQAAYEVPDKLLSSGPRKVRCAKCGKDWMAEAEPEAPPADEETEPPADAAAPEAAAGPRALPAPPAEEAGEPDLPPPPAVVPEPGERPSRALVVVAGLAWLASVGVLAGASWAAVAFRAEVMAAWGASRRLYALLGLG